MTNGESVFIGMMEACAVLKLNAIIYEGSELTISGYLSRIHPGGILNEEFLKPLCITP